MVSKALWGITAEDIVKFQLPEVNDMNEYVTILELNKILNNLQELAPPENAMGKRISKFYRGAADKKKLSQSALIVHRPHDEGQAVKPYRLQP